ncbi:uncharacterized protein PGTG_13004 [Puccinia graminis f. sp. tritici CRL 75-36-700-3]|uniref:Uncharacterized protein n=1 Tax=Puccinia graminis f. sp. tritici (strain CRL 75-36-700-3 / race SCCL) TaxID=418459 RepID=E3KQP7_PUCGT|nr:uncharacterized protein PGTG_13004 [Puccinia graminis f. sp. tritici CRL 75-36-700-3]EFP86622.2 hypothetical protein PGTG_13004 [Puccinia graminis f. sp. tritici CRL 75-36-700-3]
MEGSSQGGRMTDDEIAARMKAAIRPQKQKVEVVARKQAEMQIRLDEYDRMLQHEYPCHHLSHNSAQCRWSQGIRCGYSLSAGGYSLSAGRYSLSAGVYSLSTGGYLLSAG